MSFRILPIYWVLAHRVNLVLGSTYMYHLGWMNRSSRRGAALASKAKLRWIFEGSRSDKCHIFQIQKVQITSASVSPYRNTFVAAQKIDIGGRKHGRSVSRPHASIINGGLRKYFPFPLPRFIEEIRSSAIDAVAKSMLCVPNNVIGVFDGADSDRKSEIDAMRGDSGSTAY